MRPGQGLSTCCMCQREHISSRSAAFCLLAHVGPIMVLCFAWWAEGRNQVHCNVIDESSLRSHLFPPLLPFGDLGIWLVWGLFF